MKKQTKHYAEFFAPGSFVANTWTADCDESGPDEWPENAYAYQVYRRIDVVDGDDVYQGKAEKVGKLVYHPDSTITSLAKVKAMPVEQRGRALLSNMECNRWESVIWTRWGNWPQPWEPDRMEVAA